MPSEIVVLTLEYKEYYIGAFQLYCYLCSSEQENHKHLVSINEEGEKKTHEKEGLAPEN